MKTTMHKKDGTPMRDMYRDRNWKTGRYVNSEPCDLCARPMGTRPHVTDDEVCQGGDGPGFLLCDRKSCVALQMKVMALSVSERNAIYTAVRSTEKAYKPIPFSR